MLSIKMQAIIKASGHLQQKIAAVNENKARNNSLRAGSMPLGEIRQRMPPPKRTLLPNTTRQ